MILERCAVCGAPMVRLERYDAYACLPCRRWAEDVCGVADCEFCAGRPAEPPVEPPPTNGAEVDEVKE